MLLFKRYLFVFILLFVYCTAIFACTNAKPSQSILSQEQKFIAKMVKKHHFDRKYLCNLLAQIKFRPVIVATKKKPSEDDPWYQYKKIFLTKGRELNGVVYWVNHAEILQQAEKRYGVPASIIVAIIGVESFYGTQQGTFRTIDAIGTLAFNYLPQEQFFKHELEQFLLLTRDLKLNPLGVRGSYAGALGYPQFMPSSYRYYAVSYNHKGYPNLLNDTPDVIMSVANFLHKAGWERKGLIAMRATVKGTKYKKLLNEELKTKYSIKTLKSYGVYPTSKVPDDTQANLITLRGKKGTEFWLGFHNLYAITHYNTHLLYGVATYHLAKVISDNYHNS